MASAAGESSSASAATTTATQAQYDVKVDTDKQGKHGPIVKSSRATAGSSRVSFLSRRFRHRTCKSNHRAPLQRTPLPTIFEDAPAIVDATVSSPVSLGLFPASFHLCRVRHRTHKSKPPANLPNTLLPMIFDETPTPALFSTADKDHNPHLLSHHQVSIAHDPQQTSGLSFIHQQHANIMKLRQDHANFQQQLKEIYQAHNDAMIAIFTNAFSAHSLPLPSFRSLPSPLSLLPLFHFCSICLAIFLFLFLSSNYNCSLHVLTFSPSLFLSRCYSFTLSHSVSRSLVLFSVHLRHSCFRNFLKYSFFLFYSFTFL